MEKFQIEAITNKLKKAINLAITNNKYEDSLSLISLCAQILYQTNIEYYDVDLENNLKLLSTRLARDVNEYQHEDTIVFYDSFGLDNRGLAQIYLKALCPYNNVIYITYNDRLDYIPQIKKILSQNNSELKVIDRKKMNKVEQIKALEQIVLHYCPKVFFFYSVPDDVVATTVLYMYENRMQRYQINLTDHAFWLGAGCIDKCIEFRDYGASISVEYRGISEKNIVMIPYYPLIDTEKSFEGFPFEKKERKVIFSGGALYKTLSRDNLYYLTIDKILTQVPDTCFWYAGSGDDSKIQELKRKYPDRVFFTEERKDLYQLLVNCDLYYSTYPICGGLMFQYAAIAGKIPLTLKNNEITDDFLLNQKDLMVEFDSPEDLISECSRLLTDSVYYDVRSKEMINSVISPKRFDYIVNQLVDNKIKSGNYNFYQIDVDKFRRLYLDRFTEQNLNQILIRNNKDIYLVFRLMPIRVIKALFLKLAKRMRGKIK